MQPEYISEIIEHVKNIFSIANNAEITMETNPGTVNKQKLAGFRKAGVNRISIGIQSFDNAELKFLTRIHDAGTAIRTVYDAAESGFENISLDLIFNLPDQTKEKWKLNLEHAIKLPIKHLSAYSLILERGTILNKMVLDGKVKMQSEDHDAGLYEATIEFLTGNGFNQYEVSNFARNGFECVHNNVYWRYKDYLGFGTSAHSFADGKRWWNFSSLTFYNKSVGLKGHAKIGEEILTANEMLDEYVMLALRSKGLDLVDLKNRFGNKWLLQNQKLLDHLKQKKFLIEKEQLLFFTPNGYAVCDEILSRLS